MNKYLVLGNWKSHGRMGEMANFGEAYAAKVSDIPEDIGVGIAFPYHLVGHALPFAPNWIGAQNVSAFEEGAYTGEITAGMLHDIGTDFCLVGHSERRQYFGETIADTESKLHQLIEAGIFPIFCIGETLEQRQSGALETILRDQLAPVTALLGGTLAIAYEPVWAIGTGVAAKPADVARSHGVIRGILADCAMREAPLLYGGSVKPHNAEELATIDEVAGFLVGGASLEADSFAAIVLGLMQGKGY